MMNSEQYREHIERTFNAFCKIVLYHAALGIYKKIRRKQQFEVSLDYLREFDFEPIATTDEYFVKYDMPTTFTVRGETVIVEGPAALAEARHTVFPFPPPSSGGPVQICTMSGAPEALKRALSWESNPTAWNNPGVLSLSRPRGRHSAASYRVPIAHI